MISDWRSLGPQSMLLDGQMIAMTVDKVSLLICRVDGAYYASQLKCPHLSANLAKGTLSGTVVTCPSHGSQFDVRTGENVAWISKIHGLTRKAFEMLKKSPRPCARIPYAFRMARFG